VPKSTSSPINTLFWWLRHDWVTYKVPVSEGKVLLPDDILEPGFTPNATELWYSYLKGRKDGRKQADFGGWMSSAFFVNERAYKIFEDMLLCHGRAFPVRCSNEPHFIVLIDTMIDAIDMGKSEFERSELEERIEDDISQVKRIVLRDGFSTADDIFRIDRGFALSQNIIVSDAFKVRYGEAGLTGLFFKPTDGSD
jgi:hypothetical protein